MVVNGAFVAAFALAAGGLVLGVSLPAGSVAPLAFVILVTAFSCTGLGLISAGIWLRIRETAVLSNVIFGVLLIFTGANVPTRELPGWMQDVSGAAAHPRHRGRARLADGAPSRRERPPGHRGRARGRVSPLGLAALRLMERQARRRASIERMSHAAAFWSGSFFHLKNRR